eukprot:GHRQ01037884.1.p5 GENE.GHRQ01037884.1~~GHRQ01037884.1.p5  ORF type:complete len:101 (-),score=52.70 GHRQ01037884.1:555-857(-)
MRASELGLSSGHMLQAYAKEASTLLLSEVERYCIPLQQHSHGQPSSGVDHQQLSLNEFSGGLRSIQTAPAQQQRLARGRDAAWAWLVPGEQLGSSAAAIS